MGWTAPRTWVAGEQITAALLNEQIRDNLNAFMGTWTPFTPTWTATTTNPSIGDGTLSGRYSDAGKTVFSYLNIVMGSTTTYGSGNYRFGLPKTARVMGTNHGLSGWTQASDVSAGQKFACFPRLVASSTEVYSLTYEYAAGAGDLWSDLTPTAPTTWQPGDTLVGFIMYEAA